MKAQRQPLTPDTVFLVAAALLCALVTAWAALFSFVFVLGYQHTMTTAALTWGPVLGLAICMAVLAVSRFRAGPPGSLMIGLSTLIGTGFIGLGLWSIWNDPGDAGWFAPPVLVIGLIFILLAVESVAARQS